MVRVSEEALADIRRQIEEEPSHGPGGFRFPGAREADDYHAALISGRFCRYESTKGYVNVADVDRQVIEFSGIPDSIEIFVLDNDILVTFLNDAGGVNEPIQVNSANFYEPGIVYRRLIARNAVALAVGRIQVVAKWVYR